MAYDIAKANKNGISSLLTEGKGNIHQILLRVDILFTDGLKTQIF